MTSRYNAKLTKRSCTTINKRSLQTGVAPLQLSNLTSGITPCDKDGDVVCEGDVDDSYPATEINAMLTTHVAFKSPTFFGTIFGDVCEPG